ncbi:MAG TPA: hypothetical protein PLQ19_05995 [Aeromicrobium sp.]|nr:hypothetical protein [Aeromicrobium sp.]
MRSVLLGFAVAATLLVGGCGSANPSSGAGGSEASASQTELAAQQSLRSYLLAADAGDCDALKVVVLTPRDVDCDQVAEAAGLWSEGDNDLASLPMAAEVSDESAIVTVTWHDGSKDSWDLQRVEGKWLVLDADSADDS